MKNKSLIDKTFWSMFARFAAVIVVTMAVITVIGAINADKESVTSTAIEAVE